MNRILKSVVVLLLSETLSRGAYSMDPSAKTSHIAIPAVLVALVPLLIPLLPIESEPLLAALPLPLSKASGSVSLFFENGVFKELGGTILPQNRTNLIHSICWHEQNLPNAPLYQILSEAKQENTYQFFKLVFFRRDAVKVQFSTFCMGTGAALRDRGTVADLLDKIQSSPDIADISLLSQLIDFLHFRPKDIQEVFKSIIDSDPQAFSVALQIIVDNHANQIYEKFFPAYLEKVQLACTEMPRLTRKGARASLLTRTATRSEGSAKIYPAVLLAVLPAYLTARIDLRQRLHSPPPPFVILDFEDDVLQAIRPNIPLDKRTDIIRAIFRLERRLPPEERHLFQVLREVSNLNVYQFFELVFFERELIQDQLDILRHRIPEGLNISADGLLGTADFNDFGDLTELIQLIEFLQIGSVDNEIVTINSSLKLVRPVIGAIVSNRPFQEFSEALKAVTDDQVSLIFIEGFFVRYLEKLVSSCQEHRQAKQKHRRKSRLGDLIKKRTL